MLGPARTLAHGHLSEVELIGYAALIFLTGHLFVSFVWPSARDCVAVVWSDTIAAILRVKRDIRQLLE